MTSFVDELIKLVHVPWRVLVVSKALSAERRAERIDVGLHDANDGE